MAPMLFLLFVLSPLFAYRNIRYSGLHGKMITSTPLVEEWFDSIGGCANLCLKVDGCAGYATRYIENDGKETFRGYQCQIGGDGYLSDTTSDPWVLWSPKTSKSSVRSVTTVSGTSTEECPVVWRMWPSSNSTLGAWSVKLSSTDGSNAGSNVLDIKNTTKAKTGQANYPWLQVDLGRKYRVTKVTVLSGDETIMNMDIRVGSSDMSGTGSSGNTRISGNDRCGIYFGPTLVTQQWVEVDCGYTKGMLGQYITLQMTERYELTNALEITMLEVYGWGRVCGTDDP